VAAQFLIALLGADEGLLSACATALDQVATVTAVLNEERDLAQASLLLFVLREPIESGTAHIARLRLTRRRLPLVVLATGIQANAAVELVKCGVADLLTLEGAPPRPHGLALRRKVERVLWRRGALTLDDPALVPLSTLFGPDAAAAYAFGNSNRRQCYRAHTSTRTAAVLLLSAPHGELRCTIDDISVATEEQSGGVRVRAEPTVAAKMPLSAWQRGSEISGTFQLGGEREPIPVRLRVIRIEGGTGGVQASLALQYIPLDPRHEQQLQRFWMRCQQR
jgi:hypothetical protein